MVTHKGIVERFYNATGKLHIMGRAHKHCIIFRNPLSPAFRFVMFHLLVPNCLSLLGSS